jgi:hypothetical protein
MRITPAAGAAMATINLRGGSHLNMLSTTPKDALLIYELTLSDISFSMHMPLIFSVSIGMPILLIAISMGALKDKSNLRQHVEKEEHAKSLSHRQLSRLHFPFSQQLSGHQKGHYVDDEEGNIVEPVIEPIAEPI